MEPRELTNNQAPQNSYEEQLSNPEVVEFLKNCPPLPPDPRQAFLAIRDYFFKSGIRYDDKVFMPIDIVGLKKANCLGLTVFFGKILEQRGFNPRFEIVVNVHDKRYAGELKEFERLLHGEVFPYDQLPDLPMEKVEQPEYHFVPLEHPVIILGNQRFETTSLPDPDEEESGPDDELHNFESESHRSATLENLNGALLISQAKLLLDKLPEGGDVVVIIGLVKKGLRLWPEDRQGWLLLRDLAITQHDPTLAEEAEQKFKSLPLGDSLSYFSQYEISNDRKFIDEALKLYPAFIDAVVLKEVKLPLGTEADKKEAKFNLTVAAMCIANSIELDLKSFYIRHRDLYEEAFGIEYIRDLFEELDFTDNETK